MCLLDVSFNNYRDKCDKQKEKAAAVAPLETFLQKKNRFDEF